MSPFFHRATFVLCVLLGFFSHAQDLQGAAASGYFRVQKLNDRWILTDPDGKPFFSTGISCVTFQGYKTKGTEFSPYTTSITTRYGIQPAWAQARVKSMMRWGFNTLGAWSDNYLAQVDVAGKHLAYTPILNLGATFAGQNGKGPAWAWQNGIFPDVFDPGFSAYCQAETRKWCQPLKDDPALLGWFIDNELRWAPDGRSNVEPLVNFLNLPPHAPGRDAALYLLQQRYPDISQFNKVWKTSFTSWPNAALAVKFAAPPGGDRMSVDWAKVKAGIPIPNPTAAAFVEDCDAFLRLLAQKYFQVTTDAITASDPHHLILGCRFASEPPQPVLDAAGRYCDVISFNCYQTLPTDSLNWYARQNKPLLISEFSFRARDSGCPNSQGAGPVVARQSDRAEAFRHYVLAAFTNPNLVGYHWFDLVDEPDEGRFDGENSNNGVLDIHDLPYTRLVAAMTQVNRQVRREVSTGRTISAAGVSK